MCNKAVNTYPFTMRFILEYYKVQEMCDKVVNSCFFVFHSACDRDKTQEICDRVVYEDSLILIYCPNR